MDLLEINIQDEIACVEREIKMRERVYPRWVSEKKMTQEKSDREISLMKVVLKRLQDIKNKEKIDNV